jgi:5-formyltetrahydrofolate cyclo-ligase
MCSDLFRDARCLALYSAIHNEVSTDAIVGQALDSDKSLVFPRVSGEDLEFVMIESPAELVSGAFGVKEPKGCNLVPVEKVDLGGIGLVMGVVIMTVPWRSARAIA